MLRFNSLKKLFAKKSAAKKRRPMRFMLEQLEGRQMMAADFTANLTNGVLEVSGSPKNDYIQVSELDGKVSVAGAKINTTGGLKFTVPLRDVREVKIWGNDGNDTIKSSLGSIKSTVWAGSGQDTVTTDDGNDIIYGGIGADKIYGGDGHDIIYGGSENDTIDGQGGNDNIYGEAGDDVLRGYEGTDFLSGGIGKDSFDPDPEDTSGFDTFADAFDWNKPIINGARPEDVVQQDSYTCQTLGALAASADQGFNFGANIIFDGNFRYRVKIYTASGAKWQPVYFNGT